MNPVSLVHREAPRPRHRAAGSGAAFSLLEVLVATAIFAMGFIVILSTYANILTSYEGIRRDRDSDEDVKFARAALLAEPDIQKAQDGDEFDSTGGRHVQWTSVIEPSDTMPDLFSVTFDCEITESGQGEPQKVTQTFMALRPTWSDPVERSKLVQDVKDRIAEIQGKQPNGFVAASPAPAGGNGGRGGGAGGGGRGAGGGGRGGRGGGGPGGGNGGGRRGGGQGGGNNFGGGNGGGVPGQPGGGGFQRGGGQGGRGGQGGGRRNALPPGGGR